MFKIILLACGLIMALTGTFGYMFAAWRDLCDINKMVNEIAEEDRKDGKEKTRAEYIKACCRVKGPFIVPTGSMLCFFIGIAIVFIYSLI